MVKNRAMRRILFAAITLVLMVSCAWSRGEGATGNASSAVVEEDSVVSSARFNADSAYSYVEQQLNFGARVPNTQAHSLTGDYLANMLRSRGANVIEQRVDLKAFDGTILKSRNIIAEFNPEASQRLLLLAHWDSRPWADNDPNPEKHTQPVMGANDGASGVAVLLELARIIGEQSPNIGVDIILFDAEDWGDSSGSGAEDSWAMGAQYWAKNMHREGYAPMYGILLDMVGAENARFYIEGYSQQYAPAQVAKIWDMAKRSGYGNLFIDKMGMMVLDDHIPVNEAGIATVDIIDQSNGDGGLGFFPYWHTTYDTLDCISKSTLEGVGVTIENLIYSY